MSNSPRIYLSYRHADGKVVVDRVRERLVAHFGENNVIGDPFIAGDDISGRIREEVAICDVILIFIGPNWLTVTARKNPNIRRLDDPDDWVRLEIDIALQRDGVRVIPILINGASMPHASELPVAIQELGRKNAAYIRNDPDFDNDVKGLIKAIENAPRLSRDVGKPNTLSQGTDSTNPVTNNRKVTCGFQVAIGLSILIFGFFLLNQTGILSGLLQVPTPTVLSGTSTPIPQGWISYQNRHTETVFLEKQDIPLENCNGNNPISSVIKRDRSTTTTIELDSSLNLEVGLSAVIKASVATQFNITEGETRSTSQEISVAVNPSSLVNYELTWFETWQVGEILVTNLNNLTIPYRVRTGLQAEVRSGSQQLCPALSTSSAIAQNITPIPSIPPSETPSPTDAPTPIPPSVLPTVSISVPTIVLPNTTILVTAWQNAHCVFTSDNGKAPIPFDTSTGNIQYSVKEAGVIVSIVCEDAQGRHEENQFVVSASIPTSTNTDLPLLPTLTFTNIPTNTSATLILPTQTFRSKVYPCMGIIIGYNSVDLNVVHANSSKTSPLRNPIKQGSSVIIRLKIPEKNNEVWYQISNSDNIILGWILSDYVNPAETCP